MQFHITTKLYCFLRSKYKKKSISASSMQQLGSYLFPLSFTLVIPTSTILILRVLCSTKYKTYVIMKSTFHLHISICKLIVQNRRLLHNRKISKNSKYNTPFILIKSSNSKINYNPSIMNF